MDALRQVLEKTRISRAMLDKVVPLIEEQLNDGRHSAAVSRSQDGGDQDESANDRRPSTSDSSVARFDASSLSNLAGAPLAQLLRRPEVRIDALAPVLRDSLPDFFNHENDQRSSALISCEHLPVQVRNELRAVETEIKYAGYLDQQQKAIERLKKSEQRSIPEWFDYASVSGLSREMKEKLQRVRPQTLGQASRIPGVTPAAVSLVNVYIEIQARKMQQAHQLAD
jgi:hypothetical protein